MNAVLRLTLLLGLCLYFFLIVFFLRRKSLNLKYSLLWMAAGLVMLLAVLFPGLVESAAKLAGIMSPVNAIFALALFFAMTILMSLTAIASKLNDRIKRLTQANALLEKRVRDLEQGGKTPAEKAVRE